MQILTMESVQQNNFEKNSQAPKKLKIVLSETYFNSKALILH